MVQDRVKGNVRVHNIPPSVAEKLRNISAHLGITMGALIKQNLHLIINNYPDFMKAPAKE